MKAPRSDKHATAPSKRPSLIIASRGTQQPVIENLVKKNFENSGIDFSRPISDYRSNFNLVNWILVIP